MCDRGTDDKARRIRQQQQQAEEESGSPPPSISTMQTGDPETSAAKPPSVWTSEANLTDVRVWLAAAEADPSDESMWELLSLVGV